MFVLQVVGHPSYNEGIIWVDTYTKLATEAIVVDDINLPAAIRNMANRPAPCWAVPMTIAYPIRTGIGTIITMSPRLLSLSEIQAMKQRTRQAKT